jgi:phospholipase/carboxylesterase
MNRLATQPITFIPPPACSKTPMLLPLDNPSSPGQQVKTLHRPVARPAVFCPLHYEPGYAYPLIVWLHDAGENEQILRYVLPRISLRNYVAVAPRGTAAEPSASDNSAEACTWLQDADHVEQADERALEAIRFVRGNLNVSAARIFVAGQGAGGTMALRLAFENPQRFAGAISVNGLLPRQGLPLRRVNDLRRLPVLLSLGTAGSRDPQRLAEDERLLHAAGIPYSLIRNSGDDSAVPQMLAGLDRWIMMQVCAPMRNGNAR